MESGVISLEPLYEHVFNLPCDKTEEKQYFLQNPWENEKLIWEKYVECYHAILEKAKIPHKEGWYLWGCYYSGMKSWASIYVGVAGLLVRGQNEHRLDNRIKKELDSEREFIYIQRYSIQQIYRFKKEAYPRMYVTYNQHADRAIKKVGTTFIFWVTAPKSITADSENLNENLRRIEAGLIHFYEPIANRQRSESNRFLSHPPTKTNPDFRKICDMFESLIEKNRHSDYSDKFDFIHSRFGGY